jgi:FdhE protein
MLTVYIGLLDVWDETWRLAGDERPDPAALVEWAADRVAPAVVKAAEATAPEPLATGVRKLLDTGAVEAPLRAWLAGEGLDPVERYLARACLTPTLVALGWSGETGRSGETQDHRHCPRCGGPPQVSSRGAGDEPLMTGRRSLHCARCAQAWAYSNSTCPSCGETTGARRTLYGERAGDDAMLPHLRIESCDTCQRYLIDVDLTRDGRAVPEVDELAALPLDLYAAEHGLTKITPNLMGF